MNAQYEKSTARAIVLALTLTLPQYTFHVLRDDSGLYSVDAEENMPFADIVLASKVENAIADEFEPASTSVQITEKEKSALCAIYHEALEQIGGEGPEDLIIENFSWFGIETVIAAGFTKHQAAGLISSLQEKDLIDADGRDWALTEQGIYLIAELIDIENRAIGTVIEQLLS